MPSVSAALVDWTGRVTMRLSSVVEHLEVPQGDPLPYNVERLMDHHEAQLEDAASRTILWVNHVVVPRVYMY